MSHRARVSNNDKELERAIEKRKCDEVKVLLSTGANINHTVNEQLDTMLHTVKSAGIARDLLGYSADVNARNLYDQTPLHLAAIDVRNVEIIKVLLQHGADVDCKDSRGNTPLNYAVKQEVPSLPVVQCLVMNGADINVKNQECIGSDNHCSPLDNAVLRDNLPCIQRLIAYTLLKKASQVKFKKWYDTCNIIDLRAYYRRPIYAVITRYQHNCSNELNRMRKEKMNDNITVFQAVVAKMGLQFYSSEEDKKTFVESSFDILTNNSYPIYKDVIFDRLTRTTPERSALIRMLPKTQFYFELDERDSKKSKKINLDLYSAKALAEYLPNEDLFSFILAFHKPSKQACKVHSINNLVEIRKNLIKRVCEASTSSSYAKYFKFM